MHRKSWEKNKQASFLSIGAIDKNEKGKREHVFEKRKIEGVGNASIGTNTGVFLMPRRKLHGQGGNYSLSIAFALHDCSGSFTENDFDPRTALTPRKQSSWKGQPFWETFLEYPSRIGNAPTHLNTSPETWNSSPNIQFQFYGWRVCLNEFLSLLLFFW
ncbi:hypothetical protein BaRGS_00011379 [Batillaria attramentaria]|uniref:Uncharacterized protein n=1 Tax=Batillaria attramentaria TaxID=370345 RepID=A0ABD0LDD8_9CAEN